MAESVIHHGDCLDVLRTLADNSVDAVVTDPPYGLSFMGKKWDYDVPSQAIWEECRRVLKPGGHLLAFAGTRTQHRMAVRIEDAGFEIRDMIAWVYGSGFPKSRNLKDEWQGWGTALKPALEPITVARKPLIGTVADNVQRWGCGALNIDGCRVESYDGTETARNPAIVRDTSAPFGRGAAMGGNGCALGRWPANLIHDGSDDAIAPLGEAARFFYCAKASKRDRNSGLDSYKDVIIEWTQSINDEVCSWESEVRKARLRVDTAQLPLRVIGVYGTPISDATEWSTMLFGNPSTAQYQKDLTYITKTETSSTTTSKILNCFQNLSTSESTQVVNGETVLCGSHAEIAADGTLSIVITNEKMALALGADRALSPMLCRISVKDARSEHPTVKPTDLMRYLVRLITPPGGTVLDPFAGSGSTGKACALEGFGFIGIEREAEYVEIARSRIAAATA